MKTNDIILPEAITTRIKEDILGIKFLLKDDKEFRDKTIQIIKGVGKGETSYSLLKFFLDQKYNSESYDDLLQLKDKINDLIGLISLKNHEFKNLIANQYIEIVTQLQNEQPDIEINMIYPYQDTIYEPANSIYVNQLRQNNDIIYQQLTDYKLILRDTICNEMSNIYQLPEDINLSGDCSNLE